MRALALSALFALAVSGSVALIACSAEEDDGSAESEDDLKKKLGAEGDACSDQKKCKTGLLCKANSGGPPPGAVGLPAPKDAGAGSSTSGGPPPGAVGLPAPKDAGAGSSTSGGPPPGAVGLPAPTQTGQGICQKPEAGEEGGACTWRLPCNEGLTCVYESGSTGSNFPPGAVGLPMRVDAGSSSSGGPPPGAVGLPIPRRGICRATDAGSSFPPGAVGLPLPPSKN